MKQPGRMDRDAHFTCIFVEGRQIRTCASSNTRLSRTLGPILLLLCNRDEPMAKVFLEKTKTIGLKRCSLRALSRNGLS